MESIISNDRNHCYLCHRFIGEYDRECHHVFGGTSNRKNSEKYGLKVYLCHDCHNESKRKTTKNGVTFIFDGGVHFNREKDLKLKREAQEIFERRYGHDKFMEVFGKNYG